LYGLNDQIELPLYSIGRKNPQTAAGYEVPTTLQAIFAIGRFRSDDPPRS